jgi:hypothetical protein
MIMAKQDSVESVIASANRASAPRQYMGASPVAATNVSGNTGKQPLGSAGPANAADPAISPHLHVANPSVLATETPGAAYAIKANISKPNDPTAGATMANSRLIRPAINRSAPNFADGRGA